MPLTDADLARIEGYAARGYTPLRADSLLLIEEVKRLRSRTAPPAVEESGVEYCCNCAGEYPRADLIAGHIYCPQCRKLETPGAVGAPA